MEEKHISDMFNRAELERLCEFIITGIDTVGSERETYSERLKKASAAIEERIRKVSSDEQEYNDIHDELTEATVTCTAVFTEIGMKIGARIMAQLLFEE